MPRIAETFFVDAIPTIRYSLPSLSVIGVMSVSSLVGGVPVGLSMDEFDKALRRLVVAYPKDNLLDGAGGHA